jgi:hypothetical protein
MTHNSFLNVQRILEVQVVEHSILLRIYRHNILNPSHHRYQNVSEIGGTGCHWKIFAAWGIFRAFPQILLVLASIFILDGMYVVGWV